MSKVLTGMLTIAVLVLGVFHFQPKLVGQTDKLPSDGAKLKGVVLVEGCSGPESSVYIANPELRILGGKAFLVGSFPKLPAEGDVPECVHWIPLDQVRMLTEFKSLADASKLREMLEERHKRK